MRRRTRSCSSTARRLVLRSTRSSAEERSRDVVPLGRHRLQLRRRLRERHVDDLVAVERRHAPEAALVDEVGGFEPVARREHAVARGGGAAALDVAKNGDARLEPRSLLDLVCEGVADAPQADVAELVAGSGLGAYGATLPALVRQLVAFADDDDRKELAAPVPALDLAAGALDRDRLLGDQDHVGAAGDS